MKRLFAPRNRRRVAFALVALLTPALVGRLAVWWLASSTTESAVLEALLELEEGRVADDLTLARDDDDFHGAAEHAGERAALGGAAESAALKTGDSDAGPVGLESRRQPDSASESENDAKLASLLYRLFSTPPTDQSEEMFGLVYLASTATPLDERFGVSQGSIARADVLSASSPLFDWCASATAGGLRALNSTAAKGDSPSSESHYQLAPYHAAIALIARLRIHQGDGDWSQWNNELPVALATLQAVLRGNHAYDQAAFGVRAVNALLDCFIDAVKLGRANERSLELVRGMQPVAVTSMIRQSAARNQYLADGISSRLKAHESAADGVIVVCEWQGYHPKKTPSDWEVLFPEQTSAAHTHLGILSMLLVEVATHRAIVEQARGIESTTGLQWMRATLSTLRGACERPWGSGPAERQSRAAQLLLVIDEAHNADQLLAFCRGLAQIALAFRHGEATDAILDRLSSSSSEEGHAAPSYVGSAVYGGIALSQAFVSVQVDSWSKPGEWRDEGLMSEESAVREILVPFAQLE